MEGILIGVVTFFLIGIFHPLVIKGEYYFGKKKLINILHFPSYFCDNFNLHKESNPKYFCRGHSLLLLLVYRRSYRAGREGSKGLV